MDRTHCIAALFACGLAAGVPGVAFGHGEVHEHAASADEHQRHMAGGAPAASAARVVLRANPLLDASGKRVRLAKDVIGDRIAVVNFIYTNCTTVCPVTSATFQQVQNRLGESLGRDVVLVSVSVDPLRDTPERLHQYASRYEARAGWVWLTGAKPDVDNVLRGLGAYTPSFEDHPAAVLVGDASGWTRFLGFPSVEQLVGRVEAIRAARAGTGEMAHHGH